MAIECAHCHKESIYGKPEYCPWKKDGQVFCSHECMEEHPDKIFVLDINLPKGVEMVKIIQIVIENKEVYGLGVDGYVYVWKKNLAEWRLYTDKI